VCNSEKAAIEAFGLVMRQMQPDILTDFNGGGYDWPFILYKARQYELLMHLYTCLSGFPNLYQKTEDIINSRYIRGNLNHHDKQTIDKKRARIKISAEDNAFVLYFKVPGLIWYDTSVEFWKLYPKQDQSRSKSLNWYLEKNKLGSKQDMPYHTMWRYFEEADNYQYKVRKIGSRCVNYVEMPELDKLDNEYIIGEHMREVALYCIVDSLRCAQLQIKRTVLNDARQIANASFVSLYDALFNANGMKVRNLIIHHAFNRNIFASNIMSYNNDGEEGEKEIGYMGAFVIPPNKGLQNKLPIIGLDFSSLYPSIIMANNGSPEKIITEERAFLIEQFEATGERIKRIDIENLDGTFMKSYQLQHDSIDKSTNETDPKIGLFPYILMKLFLERAACKKEMKKYDKLIEKMEMEIDELRKNREEIPKEMLETLEEYEFKSADINSRQKAKKVFMNTFYGEAGNKLSPLFMKELAAGVTAFGRKSLKQVVKYVTEVMGWLVHYGDTDSAYCSLPPEAFKDLEEEYQAGLAARGLVDPETVIDDKNRDNKFPDIGNPEIIELREKLWSAKVERTMELGDKLRDDVNEYLFNDIKSRFLTLAYEEVLFPVAFLGKKKYFGIAHESEINFHPKHLFIRGVDIVKRGQCAFCANIGNKILWQAMSLSNINSLYRITLDFVDLAATQEYIKSCSYEDFQQTATYKPGKKNVTVHTFVDRMREKVKNKGAIPYAVPEPGEKFKYVIVDNKLNLFNIRGCRASYKKGDKIEFIEVAKHLNLDIDIEYYLINQLAGICARFITYKDEFLPPDTSNRTEREIDRIATDKAKNFLISGIKRDISQTAITFTGSKYRSARTKAEKRMVGNLAQNLNDQNAVKLVSTIGNNYIKNKCEDVNINLLECVNVLVNKYLDKVTFSYLLQLTDANLIRKLNTLYNNPKYFNNLFIYYRNKEQQVNTEIMNLEEQLYSINCKYESRLIPLINEERLLVHEGCDDKELLPSVELINEGVLEDYSLTEEELELIYKLTDLYYRLCVVGKITKKVKLKREIIKNLYNKYVCGIIEQPNTISVKKDNISGLKGIDLF
jgi:DNA polymerase elongation subunit (family B)